MSDHLFDFGTIPSAPPPTPPTNNNSETSFHNQKCYLNPHYNKTISSRHQSNLWNSLSWSVNSRRCSAVCYTIIRCARSGEDPDDWCPMLAVFKNKIPLQRNALLSMNKESGVLWNDVNTYKTSPLKDISCTDLNLHVFSMCST